MQKLYKGSGVRDNERAIELRASSWVFPPVTDLFQCHSRPWICDTSAGDMARIEPSMDARNTERSRLSNPAMDLQVRLVKILHHNNAEDP
jgi:hypothetical protein